MRRPANNHSGFTLVELLVAITLFSLVIGGAVNILFSSIASQRRTLAQRQLISEASFLQEYMGRAIRQAKKELVTPATCLTGVGTGYNYEVTYSGQGLKFINQQDQCEELYVDNGRLKEALDGVSQFLTPDEITVADLKFSVTGASQTDNLQPKVTFYLDLKTAGQKAESQVELKTQTTISERRIDAER